jgi:competence protein ComEA
VQFTVVQGIAAGAIVTGAIVAFVVRPAALAPHPQATPSIESGPGPADVAQATRAPVAQRDAIVYVAGAVAHPGVYAVASDARAMDAVAKAGGMTHDADAVAVNLAAHVNDGDEIAVPRAGESLPATAGTSASDAHARAGKRSRRGRHHRRAKHVAAAPADDAAPGAPARLVNVNTADASTLATVPGIGETLAARIVEFRAVNGPFASVDGLADVSGITPSRFDAIASFLTVGQP